LVFPFKELIDECGAFKAYAGDLLDPMPIASLMEPGFDGIATVMEPPHRQGHGATCRVG
jgi:hypothetical protein